MEDAGQICSRDHVLVFLPFNFHACLILSVSPVWYGMALYFKHAQNHFTRNEEPLQKRGLGQQEYGF